MLKHICCGNLETSQYTDVAFSLIAQLHALLTSGSVVQTQMQGEQKNKRVLN